MRLIREALDRRLRDLQTLLDERYATQTRAIEKADNWWKSALPPERSHFRNSEVQVQSSEASWWASSSLRSS